MTSTTPPSDTWNRLHTGFLILAITITLLIFALIWPLALLIAPIGALSFILSTAFGIAWLSSQSRVDSSSFRSWLTYIVANVGTAYFLTVILGSPSVYPLYFVAIFLLIGELSLLRLVKRRLLWGLQVVVFILFCVLAPITLVRRDGVITAVTAGNRTYLRTVLLFGADPDTRHQHDFALIMAVQLARFDIAQLLLDYGANPNSTSDPFMASAPALFYAVDNRDTTMIELLLNYGADPNARNDFGETALFYAVRFSKFDHAKLLLSRGADINARDRDGKTALFSVSELEMAKLLLERGIDIQVKNNRGRTALDVASEHYYRDIVTLLRSKQAR